MSLEHLFGRNEDVQKCLAIIAVQRRIEEERRKKVWASAGYPYAYQQAGGTAVQTQSQEATMEVDTVAPAAGNGGGKRKREEEDDEAKDSPSKRVKTVEEFAVPPAPATALTTGVAEAQAQPADPLKR